MEEKETKLLLAFLEALGYKRLENTSIWKFFITYDLGDKQYKDIVVVDTEDLTKMSLNDATLVAIDKKNIAIQSVENNMRYNMLFPSSNGVVMSSDGAVVSDKDMDCPTCPQTKYTYEKVI